MLKRIKIIILIIAAVLVTNVTSCITVPLGLTSSTTPLHNKKIVENLGKTEGTSSAWNIIGIPLKTRPDFDEAISDALKKKGGNALINVKWYETTSWYILVTVTTLKIEGEAIQYVDGSKK